MGHPMRLADFHEKRVLVQAQCKLLWLSLHRVVWEQAI